MNVSATPTPPRPDTLAVHADAAGEPTPAGRASAVCLDTAFDYDTAEELEAVFAGRAPGYVYSRIANPTVAHFERQMTALEGGRGAVACASGMAAISSTLLALAGAGDEIVAGGSLFGGTISLLRQTLVRAGIATRFVPATDVAAYRAAITDRTRAVFVETIGNPQLDVPDLAAIAAVAREQGVAFVVDNTAATPMLCRPATLGADIVVHSASKFINGHGTAIGGVIVDCGSCNWSNRRYAHLATTARRARDLAFLAWLRNPICRDLGCSLAPFNAFLLSVGLETIGVRMERHCANAARAARYLAEQTLVREVRYPGLPQHPDHAVAARQFAGRFGALLTVRFDDKAACFRFIGGLKLARNMANIGDTATLVIHPASTFCRELDDEGRRAAGAADDRVRLLIGIEDADDILADLEAGLAAVGSRQ